MKAEQSEDAIRGKFFSLVSRHQKQLYKFVRHQLAYLVSIGDIGRDDLAPEEVVDDVLLRAYREFVKDPRGRDIERWLIELAKKQLKDEVQKIKTVRRYEPLAIEEDIPETLPSEAMIQQGEEIFEYYVPEEDWKLEDVFPDLSIPPPEQAIQLRRLWRCVDEALTGLPEEWRRAFELRYVNELDLRSVAKNMGKTVAEVERVLEHARQYVRQRLVQSGCRFSDTGEQPSTSEPPESNPSKQTGKGDRTEE